MRTLFLALLLAPPTLLLAQGLANTDTTYQTLAQKRAGSAGNRLPQRVDLSGYVPAVIDQQQYGTCVGISVGYYLRTMLEARRRGITGAAAIAPLRYSPSFLYNQIKEPTDSTCMNGADIGHALEYLKQNGVPLLSAQPYPNCGPGHRSSSPPDSRILDYVRLFGLMDVPADKVLATKKALSEFSPVVVGIQTTPSIKNLSFRKTILQRVKAGFGQIVAKTDFTLWQPATSASLSNGHALCVVGYDDALFGEGAFKLVNSWGRSWGDAGFFWVSYADFSQYTKYGYQAYVPPLTGGAGIILSADLTISLGTFVTGTNVPVRRNRAGGLVAYTVSTPQPTGTPFKFSASVSKQTYLYLLTAPSGGSSAATLLFPEGGISPLIGPNTRLDLPQDALLVLDGPPGVENWLFLFSENALDIGAYVQAINRQSGSFSGRVLAAFGTVLAPYQQLTYKEKKMGFFMTAHQRGRVVPLLVRINQVLPSGFTGARTK